MKIALANHALRGYPPGSNDTTIPDTRRNLFAWAARKGFDGIEVGSWWFDYYQATPAEARALRDDILEFDLELVSLNCLRKCVTHPAVAEKNRGDLLRAVEIAEVLQPRFISVSLALEPIGALPAGARAQGCQISPGGSAGAEDAEFVAAAAFLAELAESAADLGVGVALELHHCSLADTSRSLLRLLELADHPNLSANPDLGNLLWAYETPEEPWYEAVDRLAGRVLLWHLKNTQRIHVPDLGQSYFVHSSLDQGDIDYRWALAKMVASGFDGYLSIEGAGPGDLLAFAARGKAYLDELLQDLSEGIDLRVQ